MGKTSRRHQKLYKMKGCSTKKTCKNYLGKGGMPSTYMPIPVNINASDKTIPNTGPPAGGFNFLNSQGMQRGGNCGTGMCPLMTGGNCGCGGSIMKGGKRHRIGCKCSKCKSKMQKGGNNLIPLNEYNVDPQTALISTGANKPFSIGGGKRSKSKKQRGGTLSNFLGQDLINLGRQFQFGLGSAYNTLSGYAAPVSPLPWRDQIPSAANINTVKASMV